MKNVLLVCVSNDGPATGLAIRVRLIANSLQEHGRRLTVLRLYNIRQGRNSWRGSLPSDMELIELPIPPGLRVGLLMNLMQVIRSAIVHAIAVWKKIDLIQAENTVSGDACTIVRWSRIPVVVDLHGAAVEEAVFFRGESFRQTATYRWLERAERTSILKADKVLVVARPMIDYLKARYPGLDDNRFQIVPVAADRVFFDTPPAPELRAALGMCKTSTVFVYSGGAQPYQCLPETLALFARLRRRLDDARLLILSVDKARITELVAALDPETAAAIVVTALDKSDVPRYLSIADAGFLLRHENALNRVSCPTKFAEYLACGVPVVTTAAAGHAPSIVAQFNVGRTIELDDEDSAVAAILDLLAHADDGYRQRCREVARQNLRWEQAAAGIEAAYQMLTADGTRP